MKRFQIDKNKSSKLDSRRLTHRTQFKEKVEELIDSFNLQEMIEKYCNIRASPNQLDKIDRSITLILDIV